MTDGRGKEEIVIETRDGWPLAVEFRPAPSEPARGVLLVGHGQPVEWDEEWPTETAQEIGFREQVLARLERAGYARDKLGMAWMEFRKPKPADVIAQFVAAGARRVLYFAASISAEAIHSQYDIPALVGRADVPEGVELVNLGAWNDDPLVIRAIASRVVAQMHAEDERKERG